jgi:hypothetical protein
MYQLKQERVINKFQSLLRSGMDYDVRSMYQEAGSTVCISIKSAERIVQRYYRGIVSQDMIDFVSRLNCPHTEEIELFSNEFDICERESRLLIRYAKNKQ